jgi:hypothetical protein
VGPLRLRTIHRAENIASALKRSVNVCQRQFVNEVLGPLVTEFIRNFGGEDATPIQHAFPTVAFSITSRLVKLVRHSAPPKASGAAFWTGDFARLSGRMSVGVQSDPTELTATQTAAWPWGRAGVASCWNYAPNRR